MTKRPIATAVARLLVQNPRNLCSHLIRRHLVRVRKVGACQLIAGHERFHPLRCSSRVVSRDILGRIRPLGRCGHGQHSERETSEETFHRAIVLRFWRSSTPGLHHLRSPHSSASCSPVHPHAWAYCVRAAREIAFWEGIVSHPSRKKGRHERSSVRAGRPVTQLWSTRAHSAG